MAIISERIFEILNDRGMTQKEFAIKTGIAEGTISDWKRGRIAEYRIVTAQSPEGMLLEQFDRLDNNGKQRLMGYLEAMVGSRKLL